MEYSDSDQVIQVLDGIVSTRVIHHPDRAFAFEVTLDLLKGAKFFAQKPPLHFHANQAEYIQAIQGKTGLELEGREIVLSPGSPEYYIGSWVNHRSYPISIPLQDGVEKVKFLLSGAKTPEPFQLNTLFFENWYRYQENVLSTGKRIDLIQILSTFDGGGTYLSPPSWMPCGGRISQIFGVVVGRWLGGLLGYQPFYREWSSDWELACRQMQTSIFQRRFAKFHKAD
ncbi:uncharacterized protein F4817DRAFT_318106 [Daldinia loculata]|uniref:uncharacterized protein n=1 Tax=Daldinia loculata TaxID=103429 RepID=UPI0020C33E99|nr:uncharacterized protein F4817DRAFT_318106 [Daldinia loculata]KAI1645180.1 hypothetical protein F4817DRAFT_318106 [Daldinia loculata]